MLVDLATANSISDWEAIVILSFVCVPAVVLYLLTTWRVIDLGMKPDRYAVGLAVAATGLMLIASVLLIRSYLMAVGVALLVLILILAFSVSGTKEGLVARAYAYPSA